MHDARLSLLSGCACLILIKDFSQVKCAECKIYKEELRVDCKGLKLDSVPQNLDPNIENLDLSKCTLSSMPDYSFQKYNNLITLSLAYAKTIDKLRVDLDVFRPLTNLKTLNLEFSDLIKFPYFYWPPSLTVLRITGIQLLELDLFHLLSLEQLNASFNFLEGFPVINKNARIRYINLDGNPIRTMSAEMLAPLCKLDRLSLIRLPNISVILDVTRFCVCSRINFWINRVKIDMQDLPCQPPKSDYKCDDEFSADALAIRSTCLERDLGISWLFRIFLYFVILLVLLAGGKISWHLYNEWEKTRVSDNSSNKEETDSNTETKEKSINDD